MKLMSTVMKDMLTEIDGQSYAVVKVLGFLVVLVFMVLEVCAFFLQKPFDAQAYGLGAGAAIAAMGAAIRLTDKQNDTADRGRLP